MPEFLQFANLEQQAVGVRPMAGSLAVALICGVLLSWLYRRTYRGTAYSMTFDRALVTLTVITAIVIMVIGNNLARAFGLVGAMSIVRFRTAVKDAQDLVFIFFSLAVGLASGVGLYTLAVASTLFVGAIISVMTRFNYGALDQRELVRADAIRGSAGRGTGESVRADLEPVLPGFQFARRTVERARGCARPDVLRAAAGAGNGGRHDRAVGGAAARRARQRLLRRGTGVNRVGRRAAWPSIASAALAVLALSCARPQGDAVDPSGSQPSEGNEIRIQRFKGDVYGASGVAQLPDGRVLVAGDDQHSPLEIVDLIGARVSMVFTPRQITLGLSASGASTKALNDLESLTIDPRGHVYGATSHALTAKGVAKPDREQLVRFDVHGNRLEGLQIFSRLKPALMALDPAFRAAAQLEPRQGGLNIEGLAWDPIRARLLIGFRSPRSQREALAVWLENPDAVFEHHADPILLPPIRLDLGGEGIRDVTYSPTLRTFVIIAGSWRHRAKNDVPALWVWSGGNDAPVELRAPELEDLKPEGVAEVALNGRKVLVVVSDDGNADDAYADGRSLKNNAVASRYVILPFDQLSRVGASGR